MILLKIASRDIVTSSLLVIGQVVVRLVGDERTRNADWFHGAEIVVVKRKRRRISSRIEQRKKRAAAYLPTSFTFDLTPYCPTPDKNRVGVNKKYF